MYTVSDTKGIPIFTGTFSECSQFLAARGFIGVDGMIRKA